MLLSIRQTQISIGTFVGDQVMVHLREERFPLGEYKKLKQKRIGPFLVPQKINNNEYVVDLPDNYNVSMTFNVQDPLNIMYFNHHYV